MDEVGVVKSSLGETACLGDMMAASGTVMLVVDMFVGLLGCEAIRAWLSNTSPRGATSAPVVGLD